MKHLALTENELNTLLYALRCGEMDLLGKINDAIENPSSRSVELVREYGKMRITLIRLENQVNPDNV
jgi:hypothetical protein